MTNGFFKWFELITYVRLSSHQVGPFAKETVRQSCIKQHVVGWKQWKIVEQFLPPILGLFP